MSALAALEATPWVAALRASSAVYPLVGAAHIVGLALTFGAIAALDLRLLGLWRGAPADVLARAAVPVAMAGVGLSVATGVALFSVRATEYALNPAFLAKLSFVALALANALALRRTPDWRALGAEPTLRLSLAAGASLALWLGAIIAGRMIAYV